MKKYIAGNFITIKKGNIGEYRAFLPTKVNRSYEIKNNQILVLVEKAGEVLGKLSAYSSLLPDIDFFIKMHINQEARASNIIEGTHTELEDLFMSEEEISPEKRDDWHEVINYVDGMNYAIERLNNGFPLTMRLVNETHKILLSGVRGQAKQPGEIRTMQNWLGSRYLDDAIFIPPAPEDLKELLKDLELFWHDKQNLLPEIIRTAITHYQFETIHPYNDGNGRVGRLLITLQLLEKKLLSRPVLYISDYFEKNKNKYFEAFDKVRKDNDIEGWVIFFLEALKTSAQNSAETLEKIVELRKIYDSKIFKLGQRSDNAQKLLEYMYSKPVISNSEAAKVLDISYNAAKGLIEDLEQLEILDEITNYSRNKRFVLREYLELFK
jgi:Fic family protein